MGKFAWVGSAGNQNWGTNTNWSPNPPSTQNGPMEGDTAIFNQLAQYSINGTDQRTYPAPAAPGLSAGGSGGTMTAGTYQVEVTYVNANGETVASSSSSQAISGAQQLTITSPAAFASATGWYAYVTPAGGSTYTRQQAPGSPTAIGTNLVLSANPTNTGANPPVSNTATYALAAINIYQTFAGTLVIGTIGNPLRVSASQWTIGLPSQSGAAAPGSGRINIDWGTLTNVVDVLSSGTSTDAGQEPVRVNGNNGSMTVNVVGGLVGIGTDTAADAPLVGTVNVASGGSCNVGPGVSLTNTTNNGGTLNLFSGPSGIVETLGGITTSYGTYVINTLKVIGGSHVLLSRAASSPDISTFFAWGGTLDCSKDGRNVTVANFKPRNAGSVVLGMTDTQVTLQNAVFDWDGKTSFSFNQ